LFDVGADEFGAFLVKDADSQGFANSRNNMGIHVSV
jgi:hypothetical protein